MKVRDLNLLQDIVQHWDGEIVVDAYDLQGTSGIAVLSLVKENRIEKSIKFEGNPSELILLFTEILRKNINKVVREQRDEIVDFKGS
ncbi:hypothetical protein AciM339_0320 [Aciduliprofundum sp. MAR08-339]|uniref:hypothetical protein n=1 Tax=Aciduliprofundum sp. (strain MAR08-339) TaxID=673860 RepID=UPI0002A492A7|nr:hypothetical protein AciM339_0320 [Aciduliprofundum sp. MAR08-339]